MLTKISLKNAKRFCCEDISLIENYEQAIDDNDKRKWICHHKLGIELSKSKEELIEIGLYYKRPACELCFMETKEHKRLHNENKIPWNKGKKCCCLSIAKKKYWESEEKRNELSIVMKGNKNGCGTRKKYYWRTADGEIAIMSGHAKRWHPDWVLIGPA